MTAEEVLVRVLEAGGEVIYDPARPRLRIPPALKPLGAEHREALRRLVLSQIKTPSSPLDPELAHRVAAFRWQVEEWSRSGGVGVPLLALPEAPEPRLGRGGS